MKGMRRSAATSCLVAILTETAAAFAPSPHGGGALLSARHCPLASYRLCPSALRLGGCVAEMVPVSLHRRSIVRPGLRAQMSGASEDTVPSEKSLALMPVLERVAFAAKKAVTESTGKGTESSGQGRYEVTSTYVAGSCVHARLCTHNIRKHTHTCTHVRTHARTHTHSLPPSIPPSLPPSRSLPPPLSPSLHHFLPPSLTHSLAPSLSVGNMV
jgi:hypothetical protein